ncbi:Putative F0F1-ATPase subunit Ca2+/Mg2+ transporter [Eubacterium ruminantium]|jgi:F0F1-type ATP synthase assembly protein I|uniref:Putative F0F1-ATPase subunit Ca2+/Mg2+ transporter n=1 Tax=Eubacterium ruminantium TaxID=42322 RepID=A0A1T4KDT8_9FIRM|nr:MULTISPECIES: AtpZ/AtpI family protein [Eubacterium]MCR5368748.1 AtpZ/AtpI family protein [Eubacterium sp.]SCW31041.1 Putative F0F1-ATPase subunit Ca2+/Mg2+ transporter [Eubacterium ruminantium]SDM24699.1 Putative F0F1-ATPase subunit Ca2+/Mg2+ transporter [Eubacterium ruminantium]SJZ40551.1 Putative F0F1-ATPase subunit Ca2+/Mg2+ transporter [Eubacterium ruminantium]
MKRSRVAENLFLVLQIGISMLVPILLCTAIGYFIDKKYHTKWIILFIVLGVLSGFRSVYSLVKKEINAARREEKDRPEWEKKAFDKDDKETY